MVISTGSMVSGPSLFVIQPPWCDEQVNASPRSFMGFSGVLGACLARRGIV